MWFAFSTSSKVLHIVVLSAKWLSQEINHLKRIFSSFAYRAQRMRTMKSHSHSKTTKIDVNVLEKKRD